MTFTENLKNRISLSPRGSQERNILKVVLGDVQQKAAFSKFTDEQGYALVKSMVKNNNTKVLPVLPPNDPRRKQYEDENIILESLLPRYWDEEKIKNALTEAISNIKTAKSDNAAIGVAMSVLNKLNAVIEGQTVKKVVTEVRNGN